MIPSETRDARIPFGKFRGKTLDEACNVGLDHDGLRYLDWLFGRPWLDVDYPDFARHLRAYLTDPDMARSLDLALKEG